MKHIIVIIFTVIVAVLLVGIVLIQKSKGGGLSSQFGGASSVMGVRQTNTFLEKGTWWLAGIIAFLSVVSAYTMPKITTEQSLRTQEAPAPVATSPEQYGSALPIDVQPADDAPAAAADNQGEK